MEVIGQLHPGERNPSTHWIGGWVGPSADLDAVAKWKDFCPWQESNPSRPAHSLLSVLTALSRLVKYASCQKSF